MTDVELASLRFESARVIFLIEAGAACAIASAKWRTAMRAREAATAAGLSTGGELEEMFAHCDRLWALYQGMNECFLRVQQRRRAADGVDVAQPLRVAA